MYLDYEHKAGVYVIDIETDSLQPTVIWCMCWQNVLTGEKGECRSYADISRFFEMVGDALFVGHNIIKFDAPALNRLAGTSLSVRNCADTLILSTLYSPSLAGGHSLDAWGERLGHSKIEFNDWSRLSDEMVKYCHQDVLITTELFKRLVKTLTKINFSEQSIWIQHRFIALLDRQHKNGFYFNGKKAIQLYQHLRQREEELANTIREVFPPERAFVAQRERYKKDGTETAIYFKDVARYEIECNDDGSYSAFDLIDFNLGSPPQRIERLTSLGWVPREFTPKGSPKPFDKGKLSPSLEEFLEENPRPEVELIARWMSINGRANMINTWLESYDERDSCIHGKLFVADTLRLRHQAPNTANIPAVRVDKDKRVLLGESGYYTYEARDLWTARPGRVLVGTDAAGLELRMLAHYLNRLDFTRQVVEGDPHQYNADIVGISRPQAKTLIYAVLYGAQAPKIAQTLGVSVKEGAYIRNLFLSKLGLKELIEACEREQREGRVELVDGSQVICPSPHAALNYKLQGGGARVMALAAVIVEAAVARRQLDALKVGDIHDEWQRDCDPLCADEYADLSVEAIRESGRRLGLDVPLDGTAKKGLTWAETH